LPLTLVGFADDVFNLKPAIRFLVQFICAALALFFMGGLTSLELGVFHFNFYYLLTPLAFIAILWSINLFNFLDGIDGYIGTEVIFIGLAMVLLTGDSIGWILVLATLGFLIWNWPKAKIFMGDVGSTLLGFSVAVVAIYHQNTHASSLVVWIILTSVFWFDATITLFRRIKNKETLSQAHRKHAYQRIVQAGFSHQKTVFGALVLNGIGVNLAFLAYFYKTYGLCFLLLDIFILYFVLRWIDKKKAFEYQEF
jgi:UDP-N-acetylmuramyl pentapeptide phosphotransferase/UDP-N-acetylglucosamine-1-phosphate transferase